MFLAVKVSRLLNILAIADENYNTRDIHWQNLLKFASMTMQV